MANIDAPFGFEHVRALAGKDSALQSYTVDASNATSIHKNTPLTLEADGGCAPSAGGDGVLVGAVAKGFKDSNGNSISFLPALTAGTVLGIPVKGQVFVVQTDSGTVVNQTAVNATADFIAAAGDNTTGFSKYELDASTIGVGQQLRILGKSETVGQENEWGDEHVNVEVVFVENAYEDNTSI